MRFPSFVYQISLSLTEADDQECDDVERWINDKISGDGPIFLIARVKIPEPAWNHDTLVNYMARLHHFINQEKIAITLDNLDIALSVFEFIDGVRVVFDDQPHYHRFNTTKEYYRFVMAEII